MPAYTLVPTSGEPPLEVIAADPSALLPIAHRHLVHEAHVYEEGEYLFTLRQGGAMASCWTIETRSPDDRERTP